MSDSGSYRNALQVSSQLIAALDDTDLNEFMGQLLQAQASRCGCPRALVNTETRAPDDGCDGWSVRPATPDPWLGSTDTCWQFKAGRSGEPGRLASEVSKPIPLQTLRDGGRFVVVTSGSNSGERGIRDRQQELVTAADRAGLSPETAERVIVYGSEDLERWCNQHPAIAARWAGRPPGLLTLDEWANSDEHLMRYQATAATRSNLAQRRADLDFAAGTVQHLHIQGPPGVGKTRFALELCREAPWRDTVVYFQQSDDRRLPELIDSVAHDRAPEVRLMIVADEAQLEHLLPFRTSVERAGGRLRLVTVGSCSSPDSQRIPELRIEPLDSGMMRPVVNGWYPAMPPEHVDYVTRLADGYLRLARLIAQVVDTDRDATVPDVLYRSDIRQLLDRMLGDGDRRALYVVAILSHVGWDGDRQEEGAAIASHMGLDWNQVRYAVNDFHRRMHIAPQGGRYRYISPDPLGIYLALDALEVYPNLVESLPAELPSEGAREAFYQRLESIAGNAGTRAYSREKLGFFFRIDDFVAPHAARRWSVFSAADPDAAAANLCRALKSAGVEHRRRIRDQARRELVARLVRIAWRASAFHDAVTALALLAEAENEPWGNNATGEFVSRYQIFLGGTALPYLRRLGVIDELLEAGSPELARLCVSALARVAENHVTRWGHGPASDQLPELEWKPRSRDEYLECIDSAIARLETVVALRNPSLQADLVAAADHLSTLLGYPDCRQNVSRFLSAVREVYPGAREPLRRTVADVIRLFENDLPPDQQRELTDLHAQFEDDALGSRLQQHVGPPSWERERSPDLSSLAAELLAAQGVLAEYWPWLTSGDAAAGWELGRALATVDSDGDLSNELPALAGSGPDLRIVCGYVAARREAAGDEWYQQWVESQAERDPQPVRLIFEAMWRCGVTDRLAGLMARTLCSRQVSRAVVGQVAYADWRATSAGALDQVLRTMADTGHSDTAISVLQRRIEQHPAEQERWKPFALDLVTSVDLIRGGGMANHYWQEVAAALVNDYFEEISAAIFEAHAGRDKTKNWFMEHQSAVVNVLLACAKRGPSQVWKRLQHYLALPGDACWFAIGFPTAVMDLVPADEVLAWVAELPVARVSERVGPLARISDVGKLSDDTLVARLIGEYGDDPMVADAFFSRYVSGSWWGPASAHWIDLAEALTHVAGRTVLAKLRDWASATARKINEMAEQEQQREQEHELLLR